MPLIVDASPDEVTSLLGDGHEEPLVLGRWPTDWSFLY